MCYQSEKHSNSGEFSYRHEGVSVINVFYLCIALVNKSGLVFVYFPV